MIIVSGVTALFASPDFLDQIVCISIHNLHKGIFTKVAFVIIQEVIDIGFNNCILGTAVSSIDS